MAIKKRTRPYEILIRFNVGPDGETFTAAHQIDITEIIDGDTIISATAGDAYALDVAGVAAIVGDQLPGLLAERDAAIAEVAAIQSRASEDIGAVLAELARAHAEIETLTAPSV